MTKKFIPQQKNVNKHSLHGLRLLEKSVQSDGWIGAQTAAADGEMIAGSARLELAADKFADVEPIVVESDGSRPVVIVRTDIQSADDPRAKRLSVADNQISHTDWNPDGDLLAEWAGEDDAIRALFADSEWQEITGEEKPTKDAAPQVDRAAELLEKWGVKLGDLWQIGEHRLICGDCTDAATVARVMQGEKAQLCFTDPPYGANIEYATHEDSQENLRKLVDGFFPLAEDYSELIALSPGINNMWLYKKPSWVIGWFYSAGSGRTPWGFSAWQPILVFGKDPKLAAGEGCHPDGFQLLMSKEDAEENRKLGHVVPKPLSVWERLMERLSNKHTSIIYEPFSGSGTTIVACQNAGHRCRAVELDPSYVAVALERMSAAFPELEIKRL